MATFEGCIRASFDIGSGATKLTIARVQEEADGLVVKEVLFEEQTEVLYGHDLKQCAQDDPAKQLSEDILKYGERVIAKYRAICLSERYRVSRIVGIATAVFREAHNGASFLQHIQSHFGMTIHLISQEQEAVLGFK